jgi:hypothetical protein
MSVKNWTAAEGAIKEQEEVLERYMSVTNFIHKNWGYIEDEEANCIRWPNYKVQIQWNFIIVTSV